MSMELLLVRLTPAQQEAIAADPELLDLVFPEDEQASLPGVLASLHIDADTLEENYLEISAILDESVEEYEWMRKAANGTGTTIRFDFGYGDAFVLSPEQVAEIAAGLDAEEWLRPDSDEAGSVLAVAAFYRDAAALGRGVIGGVG
ncbi:hypothetical protein [Actinoplanes sp. NPDC049265]|uniref:hypothetical protein n=1 Tax=Actinoplanes sp. NPDC049265 TaxID=3363902 RepID=UPI00371B0A4F